MPRLVPDQAEGLRRLFVENVRRMVALVDCRRSGQDAEVFSRLAIWLASRGKKVLLLDEGLPAGKPYAALSATPRHDISDVLYDGVPIEQAVTGTRYKVDLLAGGEHAAFLTKPSMEVRIGLVNGFYRLAGQYDVVLINTNGDAVRNRPSFAWACQDVITLCDFDAVMPAYTCIKAMHQAGERRFHLLFSGVAEASADILFKRVASVGHRHLKVIPNLLGVVPTEAGEESELFFSRLAAQVQDWPLPEQQAGYFPTLMRRLLHGHHSSALHI